MSENVVFDNFNEKNIEAVYQHFQNELEKAEEDARLGIPPEPVFRLIDDGPPPCEVTITEESRRICADLLCRLD